MKNLVELSNLKQRRPKRNLMIVFYYVQHCCEEEENNSYSLVMVYKTRGNRLVVQNEKFRSDTKRKRPVSDFRFQKSIKIGIQIPVTNSIGLVDTVLGKGNGQRDFKMVYWVTRDASVH